MKIVLIAAMSRNRVIGYKSQLPWHLSADLKRVKSLTMGKPILMGRKTFESIGRALPGRRNIIISRQPDFAFPECEVFLSLVDALRSLQQESEVFIFGGETLFRQALPLAHYMYLTLIDIECAGDAYFPVWNDTQWEEMSRKTHDPDEKNPYSYTFLDLQRKLSA